MVRIKTPTKGRIRRELEKRPPKLVETGKKKTLILRGTRTSGLLSTVLAEIYRLRKESSVRYTRRNDSVRPFESGGETSLEFFSQKTDCGMFVFGSHSKKRPDNLILGESADKPKKKEKNVSRDVIQGKIGKVYIPDQQLGDMNLPNKAKERRESAAKQK
ncbi:hypothetical protein NL676_009436 [Syzygium grande]|nr:hypothetical protein NL676_009436 [Syzygium grande]